MDTLLLCNCVDNLLFFVRSKKFKLILLMISLLIGLIPSNYAVNALITLDYVNGNSSEFSVDIYFVGTSFIGENELFPVSNDPLPVYEHFTDNLALSVLTIKVNITGYTQWDFSNMTFPDFLNSSESITMGQLFVILDNQITAVHYPEMDYQGLSINVPLGDHTATVLYIGKDENEGIVYASDSIMIRNYPKGTKLVPLKFDAIQASIIHEELFAEGEIRANITNWYSFGEYGYSYDRRIRFEPTIDSKLFMDNGTEKDISEGDSLFVSKESTSELVIKVKTNSTGVDGLQHLQKWNKTRGISFVYDMTGIHPIDTSTLNLKNGNNYLGIITLSPYGMWHKNITNGEGDSTVGEPNWRIDWNNFQPSSNITYHSSFDFLGNIDGIRFLVLLDVETQTFTSTNENTPVFTLLTGLWILTYKFKRRLKRL